jgi:hypothetical protein
MTEITTTLSADDARALTDKVKADAARIWTTLLRLYEGGAHTVLGYASWADYCAAEFDMGKSQAYRLLDAGRVHEIVHSPRGDWTTTSSSRPAGLNPSPSPSERVARELVPVLRKDPEQVEKVWGEVIELHGPKPTAAEVRQVVRSTPTPVPRRLTAKYLDTPRRRAIAENAKKRLFEFVSMRGAITHPPGSELADALRIDKAMPVLTDGEIRHLIRTLDAGIDHARRLRRSLQKHLDLRHEAP